MNLSGSVKGAAWGYSLLDTTTERLVEHGSRRQRREEETPEIWVEGVGGQVIRPITRTRLRYHLLCSHSNTELATFTK